MPNAFMACTLLSENLQPLIYFSGTLQVIFSDLDQYETRHNRRESRIYNAKRKGSHKFSAAFVLCRVFLTNCVRRATYTGLLWPTNLCVMSQRPDRRLNMLPLL